MKESALGLDLMVRASAWTLGCVVCGGLQEERDTLLEESKKVLARESRQQTLQLQVTKGVNQRLPHH